MLRCFCRLQTSAEKENDSIGMAPSICPKLAIQYSFFAVMAIRYGHWMMSLSHTRPPKICLKPYICFEINSNKLICCSFSLKPTPHQSPISISIRYIRRWCTYCLIWIENMVYMHCCRIECVSDCVYHIIRQKIDDIRCWATANTRKKKKSKMSRRMMRCVVPQGSRYRGSVG